jgi:hypothetical protein
MEQCSSSGLVQMVVSQLTFDSDFFQTKSQFYFITSFAYQSCTKVTINGSIFLVNSIICFFGFDNNLSAVTNIQMSTLVLFVWVIVIGIGTFLCYYGQLDAKK